MSRGAKRVPVVLAIATYTGDFVPHVTIRLYGTKELDVRAFQLPHIQSLESEKLLEELTDCEFDGLPKRFQRLNWPTATEKNGGLLMEHNVRAISPERKLQSHYETLAIKELQDDNP